MEAEIQPSRFTDLQVKCILNFWQIAKKQKRPENVHSMPGLNFEVNSFKQIRDTAEKVGRQTNKVS
jgi:hypothetical protein